MKVIDWECKGNVVRFYLGADNLLEWSGDDWDDAPWQYNAGPVNDRYVAGQLDYAFPFNANLVEPPGGTKDEMRSGQIPILTVRIEDEDPISTVSIFMGDPVGAIFLLGGAVLTEQIGPLLEEAIHLPQVIHDRLNLATSEARRLIVQGNVKLDGAEVDELDYPAGTLAGKTLTVGTLEVHL